MSTTDAQDEKQMLKRAESGSTDAMFQTAMYNIISGNSTEGLVVVSKEHAWLESCADQYIYIEMVAKGKRSILSFCSV